MPCKELCDSTSQWRDTESGLPGGWRRARAEVHFRFNERFESSIVRWLNSLDTQSEMDFKC